MAADFVAGTSEGHIVSVKSNSFHSNWEGGSGKTNLVGGILCKPTSLVAHPLRPEFVVSGGKGQVQKWDMLQHKVLVEHSLGENLLASAIGYFRDGSMLCMGFTTGQVFLLEGNTLKARTHFHNTRSSIQRVSCSATGCTKNNTHLIPVMAELSQYSLMILLAKHTPMEYKSNVAALPC